MTTDIIELSKQVAEVLGEPQQREYYSYVDEISGVTQFDWIYLAEDHARCAEIAADRMIDTTWYDEGVQTIWSDEIEFYSDHNNNRLKAYCVAVCKAVMEQEKQYRCRLHSL